MIRLSRYQNNVKTTAIALIALFITAGGQLSAQTTDNTEIRLEDTCAVHNVLFDNAAVPVLTRKDSENCKDSTLYHNLAEKIRFYTNFESGRVANVMFCGIDTVQGADNSRIAHYTYDIYSAEDPLNPVDTALAPSSRWFYFLMTGVRGKSITMNIRHSDPRAPMYSYDGENFERFDPFCESVVYESEDHRKKLVTTKTFEKDSVYIAYYTPYTNGRLEKKLEEWRYRNGVAIHSIGKSSRGREMPMLLITNTYKPDKDKKKIYIHGRIHPSESPASWCLEGLIDTLTSNSEYARALRDNAVFYILPFINPDGVALGYSRCNANGVNMEINYNREDTLTEQEVKNVKKFIETTTYGGGHIDMFINFHSQVANCATYWVHTAETTSRKHFKDLMTFCALTADHNPYFHINSLSFSKIHPKYIEGYFWDKFGEKTVAITWETPYSSYNREDSLWVTNDNLKELGLKVLKATGDFLGIESPDRVTAMPVRTNGCIKNTDTKHIYPGDRYYTATSDNASARYKVRHLQAGKYDVYKWIVGKNKMKCEEGENCWEFVGEHSQEESGDYSLKIKMNKGDKANAIILIRK